MNTLIAYASAHGSTAEVAQFIGRILEDKGIQVTVASVETVQDVSPYDVVVLGTAIHASTWLPQMTAFVSNFQTHLGKKPIYFWVNCIRVLEQYGHDHVMDNYMVHGLLNLLNVRDIAIFAGKLDLTEVDWNERWTLAARYDGSTWPSNFDGDFRNWTKIREWAAKVASEIQVTEAKQA
jgi:menaquinone-dependent protoporphyrinogen oxidase